MFMFYEAHWNHIVHNHVTIDDLPASFCGFKIYFISDVHRRVISNKMLALAASHQPDIVVIGGDLTERYVPLSRTEKNISRLSKIGVPVYFVRGNHDVYVYSQKLEQILTKHGVKIIRNRSETITRYNEAMNIVAVDDSTNEEDDLEQALDSTQKGIRLLISHNPNITEKIREHHQIALVISGHTHGGQIRVFGWGPRENGGIKQKPFGPLIISNGYGTTTLPFRLGAPPDTRFVTLVSTLNDE